MTQTMKELQRIKGIGPVLAQRFFEAGYDTFSKITAAGEEGLRNIRGIKAQMVHSILTQASELAGEADKTRAAKIAGLQQKTVAVATQVQDIALNVQKRFQKEIAGKRVKKVKKEIAKIITSLEKAGCNLQTKRKKTSKVLVKAEKKLAALTNTGLKGLGKGLKKTRKSLTKNLPK